MAAPCVWGSCSRAPWGTETHRKGQEFTPAWSLAGSANPLQQSGVPALRRPHPSCRCGLSAGCVSFPWEDAIKGRAAKASALRRAIIICKALPAWVSAVELFLGLWTPLVAQGRLQPLVGQKQREPVVGVQLFVVFSLRCSDTPTECTESSATQ